MLAAFAEQQVTVYQQIAECVYDGIREWYQTGKPPSWLSWSLCDDGKLVADSLPDWKPVELPT